ncbi:MAG: divalent-cation tolerance protein CutA [Bacilli bacterium]|nr:divalent-cation tolerance protein CutA [Bacilli bacterium]
MKYIMITTTFDNKEEANKIIDILLSKRLVSCCQLSNIESSYHWKGNIEHANEYLLLMKSKKELFKEIEKVILENHSYEIPQLVAYDIVDGYKDYLDWIDKETKNI